MREILFRGKRVDNGEWVEGSYLATFPDTLPPQIRYYLQTEEDGPVLISVDIIPETVGQYTGLTDINGTKIFEGDIVEFCDIKGVINFDTGCYCVKTNKPDWRGRNNPAIDIVLNEYENELKVIGNIHDNHELLKEREGK